MTERGMELSDSHGSLLHNDFIIFHLNNDNPLASNRSRSKSSLRSPSWKRYLALACIAITSLCLIQFGASVKYFTTTMADTLYSQIMDLPSEHLQPSRLKMKSYSWNGTKLSNIQIKSYLKGPKR
eukprot:scaffold21754_cov67-Skeletonema_dohrnii-CCMP3373.AAC.1